MPALSVIIPIKNEEKNLPACLAALAGWADEIVVADSGSMDRSAEIAAQFGATIIQFEYQGGWPKKRQWVLDTYPLRNDWVLLLDADEILLPPLKEEIAQAIQHPICSGYTLLFQMEFLGKRLRYAYPGLRKLSLFRKGTGRYEKRLEDQDASMADMEIHEHVVVSGSVGHLQNPVLHRNYNSLSRYILKHNEYSNWEAKVLTQGGAEELPPAFWGNQAQRRRWLKRYLLRMPGTAMAYFFYNYVLRGGFLDGKPGLYYCLFAATQMVHVKAKIYELEQT